MAKGDTITCRFAANDGAQYNFYHDNTHRFPAYLAGQGSGKTTAGAAKLLKSMCQFPKTNSLVVEPTRALLDQVAIPAIERVARDFFPGLKLVVNRSGENMRIACPQLNALIFLQSGLHSERITGFEVGRTWIDEPARVPDFSDPQRNLWLNCLGRTRVQKVPEAQRQIFITGTHEGKGTWVYRRWEENADAQFFVHRGSTLENPDAAADARTKIEQYGPELSRQYIYGEAIDSETCALAYDLIVDCQSHEATNNMPFRDIGALGRTVFVGVDIGRSKSLTVIWIATLDGERLVTRNVVQLRDTPFAEQHNTIREVLRISGVARLAIDAGYNPQLAEQAVSWAGERAIPVTFNNDEKARMVQMMQDRHQRHTIVTPVSEELAMDFYAVKRVVSDAGNVRFIAPYSADGHSDNFWACALCCRAAAAWGGKAQVITDPRRPRQLSRREALRAY